MQGNLLLRVDRNMANCMNRAVKIRLYGVGVWRIGQRCGKEKRNGRDRLLV